MHQLKCHASSHVCALCHGIDCPSLFRCLFASSRIDDDVETDEAYDNTSVDFISTPGCWVSRQVFTHMNHCFRSSLVTDSSVVFLLALLFDACLDPITCHPAAMNIALPPHLQPRCLLACVVVSCLGLFVLESCCHLSYHLFSMIDGLVIINILLMFGVIIIWW